MTLNLTFDRVMDTLSLIDLNPQTNFIRIGITFCECTHGHQDCQKVLVLLLAMLQK